MEKVRAAGGAIIMIRAIKKRRMSWEGAGMGEGTGSYGVLWGNPREREILKDQRVDGS
jgi:hypothetical protein